jgi:hypothetical protein
MTFIEIDNDNLDLDNNETAQKVEQDFYRIHSLEFSNSHTIKSILITANMPRNSKDIVYRFDFEFNNRDSINRIKMVPRNDLYFKLDLEL